MTSEDHGLDWVQNWHVWKVTRDWSAGWVLKFMLHYIYNLLYFYITFYTSTSSECAAYHGCTTSFFRLLVRGHGTQPVQLGHRFPLMLAFTDPSLVKPGSRIGSGYRGHRPCRILQGQSWLWHFLDRPDRKPVVWYFPDFSCQSI